MEFFNRDVETCCCCCELRTGNIVLGILNALGSGLSVIAIFLSGGNYNEKTDTYDTYSAGTILLLVLCMMKFFFELLFVYGVVKRLQRIIRAYYIMYFVFVSLWGILAVLSIFILSGSLFTNMILHLLMDGYAFIVCRSYYRQLQKQEQV